MSGTLQQGGTVTPGHLAAWAVSGVLSDAGTSTAPSVNSLGIYGNGGTPFGITNTSVPGSPTGSYTFMGLGVSQTAAYINVTGGQSLPFQILVNGLLQASFGPTSTYINLQSPLAPASGGTGVTSTSLIPVTASGTTTARTLAARFADIINAKDFGADPSEVFDSTAAINNALTAAGSTGTVFLPPGNYLISSTINVGNSQKLIGAGRGVTTITKNSSSTFPVITIQASGLQAAVQSLTINGNATTNTRMNNGVFVTYGATYCRVFDCEITATSDNGVEVQANNCEVAECYIHGCISNGIYVYGGEGAADYNYIHDNICAYNSVNTITWDGIDIDPNASYNVVSNNIVIGNDIICFENRVGYQSFGNQVIDNWIFGSPENGIDITGAQIGFRITGNYVEGLTAGSGDGHGIFISQTTSPGVLSAMYQFVVSGNQISGPQLAGIYITGNSGYPPSAFQVTDNDITNPSAANAGAHSGIEINTVAAFNYSIQGNRISDANSHMKYAIDAGVSGANAYIANNRCDTGTVGVIMPPAQGTFGCYVINNPLYNPTGFQTSPSLPATGVALTNPFPYPVMITLTGGTVTNIQIGSASTGLTSGAFTWGVGETLTITYSAAPTLRCFGL